MFINLYFKYSLQDSVLVNSLELKITNKDLTFISNPKFQANELIAGSFTFETPIYYVDSLYNYGLAGGKGENMDQMITTGKIYFICELRNKKPE